MDTEKVVLCLLTGLCITIAAFMGRAGFASLLDVVQRDLDDRLRSLRIKPTRLRSWIHVWLGILLTVFLCCGLLRTVLFSRLASRCF